MKESVEGEFYFQNLKDIISQGDIIYFQCEKTAPFSLLHITSNTKRLLGYSNEAFLKEPDLWQRCIHPEDLTEVMKKNARVTINGKQKFEYRFRHSNGEYIWICDELHSITGGNVDEQYIGGSRTVITQQKKKEDDHRQQEEQLKLLKEAISQVEDIILIHRFEKDENKPKLIFANKTFYEKTGYTIEEASGSFPNIMWGPETDESSINVLIEAYRNEQAIHDQEIINYTKNNTAFWASLDIIPFKFSDSEKTYNVVINRDITYKKISDRLLKGQLKILEMISRGAHLDTIFDEIAHFIEDQNPDLICAIFQPDQDNEILNLITAPKIPTTLSQDFRNIGINSGTTCSGKAARTHDCVNCEDVPTDPLWEDYREMAAKLDIKSSLSTPVMIDQNNLGGVITVYKRRGKIDKVIRKTIDIAAFLMNISVKRKEEQVALRESEVKYKTIFELAYDGILLMRNDHIIDFNSRFMELFEGSRDQLMGKTPADISPDTQPDGSDSKERSLELIKKTLAGEPQIFEWKHRTLTGKLFDVNISMKKVVFGVLDYILIIMSDISQQKLYHEKLLKSLKEKETLLAEMHNRVKNNLAVISGLLELQFNKFDDNDIKQILQESQSRIKTIALIHESLYHSEDLSNISFDNYLDDLCSNINETYRKKRNDINIYTEFDPITFNIKQAIPCGLIANELIINAYKHAFIHSSKGNILIQLQLTDNYVTLRVKDDGKGLPESFDPTNPRSLGIKLIVSLTRQLEGFFYTKNNEGAEFIVQFPYDH